jgi:hypothetical protein
MNGDELDIVRLLKRIAVALEQQVALMQPPAPEPPMPVDCQHPDDQRADFGITDGREDWLCRVCGKRSLDLLVTHGG